MGDYEQSQEQSEIERLKERIDVLEGYVEDIGVTLYNFMDSLRKLRLPESTRCPPMCPTRYRDKPRGEGEG